MWLRCDEVNTRLCRTLSVISHFEFKTDTDLFPWTAVWSRHELLVEMCTVWITNHIPEKWYIWNEWMCYSPLKVWTRDILEICFARENMRRNENNFIFCSVFLWVDWIMPVVTTHSSCFTHNQVLLSCLHTVFLWFNVMLLSCHILDTIVLTSSWLRLIYT